MDPAALRVGGPSSVGGGLSSPKCLFVSKFVLFLTGLDEPQCVQPAG